MTASRKLNMLIYMADILLHMITALALLQAGESDGNTEDIFPLVVAPGRSSPYVRMEDWRGPVSAERIAGWAGFRESELLEDMGPHVTHQAYFLSGMGSILELAGFRPFRRYTLWIDFVRYRYLPAGSELVIIFRPGNDQGGERKVTVKRSELPESGLFGVHIPYEMTYTGSVTVEFRELSDTGNSWGIWDMTVMDGIEPPADTGTKDGEKEPDGASLFNKSMGLCNLKIFFDNRYTSNQKGFWLSPSRTGSSWWPETLYREPHKSGDTYGSRIS